MFRKLMMLLAVVGACGLVTPGCGDGDKKKDAKGATKDAKEKMDEAKKDAAKTDK